ncbi:MAG: hypothetical protein AABY64_00735 [Bdellovibrionota bacterium]
MKVFMFIQILVLISSQAFAAKYMMVTPQELGIEIPDHAIVWNAKAKSSEKSKGFLICEDEEKPRLRSAHGAFKFVSVEACEKVQMMLRLASPQCPLQMNVDSKTERVRSYHLECDKLKL